MPVGHLHCAHGLFRPKPPVRTYLRELVKSEPTSCWLMPCKVYQTTRIPIRRS